MPNITGQLYGDEYPRASTATGAFYISGQKGDTTTGGGYSSDIISFDASRSNGLYGDAAIVQPKALTAVYIIKT